MSHSIFKALHQTKVSGKSDMDDHSLRSRLLKTNLGQRQKFKRMSTLCFTIKGVLNLNFLNLTINRDKFWL